MLYPLFYSFLQYDSEFIFNILLIFICRLPVHFSNLILLCFNASSNLLWNIDVLYNAFYLSNTILKKAFPRKLYLTILRYKNMRCGMIDNETPIQQSSNYLEISNYRIYRSPYVLSITDILRYIVIFFFCS